MNKLFKAAKHVAFIAVSSTLVLWLCAALALSVVCVLLLTVWA